jgi:hypothetical protein
MKKTRLLFLAVLCAVWPATARAQWDFSDWAQPGSGPGPYRSNFGLFTRLFCVTENRENQAAALRNEKPKGPTHQPALCFDDTEDAIKDPIKAVVDVEYGHASSNNPRFTDPVALAEALNNSPVTVNTLDVSYSYRVSPYIDVGVAIGSLSFSGQGFETQSHLTLTPIRVTIAPLAFLQGDKKARAVGRILRIKYYNRRIVGDVLATDFGSKGSYVQHGEFNQGIFVGIDVLPLFYAYRK